MSYILDALRKIEKDESQPGGSGSRLLPGNGPPGRPPRRKWPFILAATVVVGAVIVIVFLRGGGRELPVEAAKPLIADGLHEKKSEKPRATAATASDTAISPAPLVSEAAKAVPPRGETMETRTALRPATESAAPIEEAGEEVSFEDVFGDLDLGDVPAPSAEVIASEGGDAAVPNEASRENGGATGRSLGTNSPEAGRLYYFEELPEDLKAELGELNITGHIYSEDANFRLLMIDDGVRREGDAISPGLVLKEITGQGAHFTYRGFLFLVEAF